LPKAEEQGGGEKLGKEKLRKEKRELSTDYANEGQAAFPYNPV